MIILLSSNDFFLFTKISTFNKIKYSLRKTISHQQTRDKIPYKTKKNDKIDRDQQRIIENF